MHVIECMLLIIVMYCVGTSWGVNGYARISFDFAVAGLRFSESTQSIFVGASRPNAFYVINTNRGALQLPDAELKQMEAACAAGRAKAKANPFRKMMSFQKQ
jgi:hypothetical protein